MKLPAIIIKYKFIWGLATGAFLMLIITSSMGNPLSANISEEELNIRSNSVIKTQQEEIKRLRTELRAAVNSTSTTNSISSNSTSSTFLSSSSQASTIDQQKACKTHTDCPAINMVCQSGSCRVLQDPACACMEGINGAYVLCIENQGEGPAARTVECGNDYCTEEPFPRCTNV